MSKYYTGVGSRQTPPDVLALMERAARWLLWRDWTLRSGHAAGADRSFERGANGEADVYLPWPGFGQSPYEDDLGAPVIGRAVTPTLFALETNYRRLVELGIRRDGMANNAVVKLHGRNVCQVLGHEDDSPPARFVLCWCKEPDGKPQGGTATAVLLARQQGIEVINLWHAEQRARLEAKIAG